METQNINAAHNLYVLYETLSDDAQKLFQQELSMKHRQMVESVLQKCSLSPELHESAWLAETALAEDWLRPEEDEAWAHLQLDK